MIDETKDLRAYSQVTDALYAPWEAAKIAQMRLAWADEIDAYDQDQEAGQTPAST